MGTVSSLGKKKSDIVCDDKIYFKKNPYANIAKFRLAG